MFFLKNITSRSIVVVAVYLSLFSVYVEANWEDVRSRCTNPDMSEPIVTQSDFHWDLSHADNRDKGNEIYQSGKRLYMRAFYDENKKSFVIPHHSFNDSRSILLTEKFIISVKNHIEKSLQNRYSEEITFSDMGHSHLYFEKEYWEKEYSEFVKKNSNSDIYQKMLSDENLKVLYHTAEQIKLKEAGQVLQDSWAQWRYHSRNVLGYTDGQKTLEVLYAEDNRSYNTVVDIEGHHRWSAGFNISQSKDGCFPYQVNGKVRYFDISLAGLPFEENRWIALNRAKTYKKLIEDVR